VRSAGERSVVQEVQAEKADLDERDRQGRDQANVGPVLVTGWQRLGLFNDESRVAAA